MSNPRERHASGEEGTARDAIAVTIEPQPTTHVTSSRTEAAFVLCFISSENKSVSAMKGGTNLQYIRERCTRAPERREGSMRAHHTTKKQRKKLQQKAHSPLGGRGGGAV